MPSTKILAQISCQSGNDSAGYSLFLNGSDAPYVSGVASLRDIHFILKGAASDGSILTVEYI